MQSCWLPQFSSFKHKDTSLEYGGDIIAKLNSDYPYHLSKYSNLSKYINLTEFLEYSLSTIIYNLFFSTLDVET